MYRMVRFLPPEEVFLALALLVTYPAVAADSQIELPITLDFSLTPGLPPAPGGPNCVDGWYFSEMFGVTFINPYYSSPYVLCMSDIFAKEALNGLSGIVYEGIGYGQILFHPPLPQVTKVQFNLSVAARPQNSDGSYGPMETLSAMLSYGMADTTFVPIAAGGKFTVAADSGRAITSIMIDPVFPPSRSFGIPLVIINDVFIDGGSVLDLATGPISVAQTGMTIGTDEVKKVTPGVPVQIAVPLSGSGFNYPENRTTLNCGRWTGEHELIG